jgi:hypothetical protein
MRKPWVVDTNVGIVANDRSVDGSHLPGSVAACAEFLKCITRSGSVAVDMGWEIISEYRHKLRSSGQPGPGDAFLKWVLTNQANDERCLRVDDSEVTVPAPLKSFDADDHKFIKTALGCPEPRIAEAVDGLWWKRRKDFEAAGIEISYLCPEEIKANSDSKHGPDE